MSYNYYMTTTPIPFETFFNCTLPLPAFIHTADNLKNMIMTLCTNTSNGLHNYTTTTTNNSTSSTKLSRTLYIHVIFNILGCIAILTNFTFLLIVRILNDKSSAFYKFIKNLSFADLMASFFFVVIQNLSKFLNSFLSTHNNYVLLRNIFVYVFRSIPWFFLTSYLLTLFCLTLNQYMAVCIPITYNNLAGSGTENVTFFDKAIRIVWLLSSLQLLIPVVLILAFHAKDVDKLNAEKILLINKIELQAWLGIFGLVILATMVFNFCIFHRIRELKKEYSLKSKSVRNQVSQSLQIKMEASITVVYILCTTTLFRLPFPIVGILSLYFYSKKYSRLYDIVNLSVILLLYINFIVDPLIYICRLKEFKKSFMNLMNRMFVFFKVDGGAGTLSESNMNSNNINNNNTTNQTFTRNVDLENSASSSRSTKYFTMKLCGSSKEINDKNGGGGGNILKNKKSYFTFNRKETSAWRTSCDGNGKKIVNECLVLKNELPELLMKDNHDNAV